MLPPCDSLCSSQSSPIRSQSSGTESDDDDFIIREPPKVTPPRGRHWVDAYVKAWYFDEVREFYITKRRNNPPNSSLRSCSGRPAQVDIAE